MTRIFVPGEKINLQSYYLGLGCKGHAWTAMFDLGQGMKVLQAKIELLGCGHTCGPCGRTGWKMTQEVGSWFF